MNLKPFDLNKALEGEKVVMRDGTEVIKIIESQQDHAVQTIYALFLNENGKPSLLSYSSNGLFHFCKDAGESCNDLFMAPKVKTYWINVYKRNDEFSANVFKTKEAAEDFMAHNVFTFLKTISFEIEE